MANKLYQQMNNSNYQSNFINQLNNNNPQLKQVLDLVKNNGGDARSLFYQLAKQKGIDPQTILNQLK